MKSRVQKFYISLWLIIFVISGTIYAQNFKTIKVGDKEFAAGELIIKFKKELSTEKMQAVNSARTLLKQTYKAEEKKKWDIGAELWKVEPEDVTKAIEEIKKDPSVEYVEPNYIFSGCTIPNDPNYSEQWALHNNGQAGGINSCDISAESAWNITTGDSTIVVGVLDSGIDYNHEDLKNNIWHNTRENLGNGIDDDGNGYIDDCIGWNFVSQNNNPMDDEGHGTHVSGIIGAFGNNTVGVAGVAWKVKLLPLKFLDNTNHGQESNAITAIEYARKMGVKIINNSWGGIYDSNALRDEFDLCESAGILMICASGNMAYDVRLFPFYPGSFPNANIIDVASSNNKDILSNYSNWGGEKVPICAPGENILSCSPQNSYKILSGTSMAAGFVTGVAVLIKSINSNIDYIGIKKKILEGADLILQLNGLIQDGRRLNAFTSVSNLGLQSLKRVITFKPTRINNFSNDITITLTNITNHYIMLRSVEIPNGFIIKNEFGQTITFPFSINSNDSLKIRIIFSPSENIKYDGFINFKYFCAANNREEKLGCRVIGTCYLNGTIIKQDNLPTILTKAESPYYIFSDLQILSGHKLIIKPGVNLKISGRYTIRVEENAQLIAQGSVNDSITFDAENPIEGWGGIFIKNSADDDTISYCVFRSVTFCSSDAFWRGVITSETSNPSIHDCKIESNQLRGIAVYGWNSSNLGNRILQINNNIISNNRDGGILIEGDIYSSVLIQENLIYNNYAVNGGGICIQSGANITIKNNMIFNNTAFQGGGILYGNPNYKNCLISQNLICNNCPEGIHLRGVGKCYNNTVAFNNGPGIIIDMSSQYTFTNEIIWQNKSDKIVYDQGSKYSIVYSIVDGEYNSSGNIYTDPMFVKRPAGIGIYYSALDCNWSLSDSSKGINASDPENILFALSDKDIIGNSRMVGKYVDLGALENQSNNKYLTITPRLNEYKLDLPINKKTNYSIKLINSGLTDLLLKSVQIQNDVNNWILPVQGFSSRNIKSGQIESIELSITPTKITKAKFIILISSDSYNYPYSELQFSLNVYSGTKITQQYLSGKLTAAGNPYLVLNDISVMTGSSFEIAEDVEINFANNAKLFIPENAQLIINGSTNKPVILKALDSVNVWRGVVFQNSNSDDIINNLKISGVVNNSAISIIESSPTIKNSEIFNNIMTNSSENLIGGGIYIFGIQSKPYLEYLDIHENIAFGAGGGIGAYQGAYPLINRCFIHNNSSCDGGGIAVTEQQWNSIPSNARIKNCLIVNNSCTNLGGGIYTSVHSSIELYQNTIANNLGAGVIIYNSQGEAIFNNIIWGNKYLNRNLNQFLPISIDTTSLCFDPLNISYSIVELYNKGFRNINSNPGFINPTSGIGKEFISKKEDWQLKPDSPAKDAGFPEGIKDEDGSIADIGAFGGLGNPTPNNLNGIQKGFLKKGVYFVTDNIKVLNNDTLTIESGTILNLLGSGINVDGGILICEGSIDSLITFTSPVGIRWSGINAVNNSKLLFNHVNVSLSNRSGISLNNSAATISNAYIHDNYGITSGGFYAEDGCLINLSNSVISNNSSGNSPNTPVWVAGGVSILSVMKTNSYSINNCTITNNLSKATIDHPTGGIYIQAGQNKGFWNNIVWGNSHAQIGGDPIVKYCDISDQYPGIGNICLDPKFVNSNNEIGTRNISQVQNWNLKNDSPCLDAGDPNYLFSSGNKTDILGNIRVYDGLKTGLDRIDIGAYEYGAPKINTKTVTLNNGWNISSVPLKCLSMYNKSIFSNASSSIFSYQNGYQTNDTLKNGKGYWVKFNENQNIQFEGVQVNNSVIPVAAGWNLIGPYEKEIATNTIITTPGNILASNFFGYNNGYVIPPLLESGKGYWIKAKQDGVINIPVSTQKINPGTLAEINPIMSNMPKLSISDAGKNTGTLYIISGSQEISKCELPPAPPQGIFDVRWSGDKLVEILNGPKEIIINSAQYPVAIKVEGCSVKIKDKINGTFVNQFVRNGQTITISNKLIERLEITGETIPSKFELYQNYPNPFNPTTKIKFAIPVKSSTRLTIFNTLGQRVEELINKELEPGYHEIEWNGSKYATGVYLCQLRTVNYSAVKKMLILK